MQSDPYCVSDYDQISWAMSQKKGGFENVFLGEKQHSLTFSQCFPAFLRKIPPFET